MNKLKPDPANLINKIISEMKDIVFILGNNSIENIRNNYAEFVCNKNYDGGQYCSYCKCIALCRCPYCQ